MNYTQPLSSSRHIRKRPQLTGWPLYAAILLTSSIFATMISTMFKTDATATAAALYLVWLPCVFVLVAKAQNREPKHQLRSKLGKFFAAFLVALLVSSIAVWVKNVRSDTGPMFLQVAALSYMTMPFFAMQAAAKSNDAKPAVMLTCHVILALCLYSIGSDLIGLTNYESGNGRYFGSLGDQSAWILTLPLLVYFSRGRFILAIVTGLALVLTGSRAPALVVLAGFLILMLFSPGRRRVYFLMLFGLVVMSFLQSSVFGTLLTRFKETELVANDRLETARVGLQDFANSPIFGNGYNSFVYFHPWTIVQRHLGALPTQTSTFVQMLSDGGLILFLPYFMFVLAATVGGIAYMKRSGEINDSGISNGVIAWLMSMLWLNQSALWFVVGSCVGPLVLGMAGTLSGYQARLQLRL